MWNHRSALAGLLALCCATSYLSAKPMVSLPLGAGDVAAVRVTTPGERLPVTVKVLDPHSAVTATGAGVSRADARAAGGWVYVRKADALDRWYVAVGRGAGQLVPRAERRPSQVLWCTTATRAADSALRTAMGVGLVDAVGSGATPGVAALTDFADVPPLGQALAGLQSIVLDRPGLAGWPELRRSLAAYLLNGGRLVICPAALPDAAAVPELAPYLPRDGQGRLRDGAGAVDTMAQRRVGRGWVAVLARQPSANLTLWRQVRLNCALKGRDLGSISAPVGPDLLARMVDDSQPSPRVALLAYLLAYLACMVPWRRRARHWLRAPLVAAAFLAAAPLLLRYTGRQHTTEFEATVLRAQAGSRYARASTWAVVSPGRTERLWLGLPAGTTRPSWGRYGGPVQDEPSHTTRASDGTVCIWPNQVRKNTMPLAFRDWTEDLGGPVSFDIAVRDGRASGRIANASRFALRGAVLRVDKVYVPIGTVPAGAEIAVRSTPTLSYPAIDDLILRMAPGSSQPAARLLHPFPYPKYLENSNKADRPALLAWVDDVADGLAISPPVRRVGPLRMIAVEQRRAAKYLVAHSTASAVLGGTDPWEAAAFTFADLPRGPIRLQSSGAELRVWATTRQRWEPLAYRPLAPVPNGPRSYTHEATLATATGYLNDGVLLLGRPLTAAPGREGSSPPSMLSTTVSVSAER